MIRHISQLSMAPKAVFLDWDGTVVDQFPTVMAAMNATLSHMGVAPWSYQEARERIVKSARETFPEMFGVEGGKTAMRFFEDSYDHLSREQKPAYINGADILLDLLSDNTIPYGIVTNKRASFLDREVTALNLAERIMVLVPPGTTDFDKPHPSPLLHAIKAVGIEPEKITKSDIWFIGDAHTDVLCANAAGVTAIYLDHDGHFEKNELHNLLEGAKPDYYAKNMHEISNLLSKIGHGP